jgi:hypothetical protein
MQLCKRRPSARDLSTTGKRLTVALLAYDLRSRLLINFASSCQRLGHKVVIFTAKDPGTDAMPVQVTPLDSVLGSEALARIFWLPAVCFHLCFNLRRRYDYVMHEAEILGVFTHLLSSDSVFCVPGSSEAAGKPEASRLRACPRRALNVVLCKRRLQMQSWKYWSSVVVEEGATIHEDINFNEAKVRVIQPPTLDICPTRVQDSDLLSQLEIPEGQNFFVASVLDETEAAFLLDTLRASRQRPLLVFLSAEPLRLDVGDLPVKPVVAGKSHSVNVLRALTRRSVAYVHVPSAGREALEVALLEKRPVIAYGDDLDEVDLLSGEHAVKCAKDPKAVAKAIANMLHLVETDEVEWAELGRAAKQRLYDFARVDRFDRIVSEVVNPVALSKAKARVASTAADVRRRRLPRLGSVAG